MRRWEKRTGFPRSLPLARAATDRRSRGKSKSGVSLHCGRSLREDKHPADDLWPGRFSRANPEAKVGHERGPALARAATFLTAAGRAPLSPRRVRRCAWASHFPPAPRRREWGHLGSTMKSCAGSVERTHVPPSNPQGAVEKPSSQLRHPHLGESPPPRRTTWNSPTERSLP